MDEVQGKDYKVIVLKGNDLDIKEFDNEHECDIFILKIYEDSAVTDVMKIFRGRLMEYEIYVDIGKMVLWNIRNQGAIPKETTRLAIRNKDKK